LGTDRIQEESLALVRHLERWVRNQEFEVILATMPLPQEPDLTGFLGRWLTEGRLGLARTGPQRSLEFGLVTTLEGPWVKKPYGLLEPPVEAPGWTPGPKTLVLVPGVAFSPAPGGGADRLGRGAGYYDRWLARFGPQVFTLGVGLAHQTLERVPTEAHDQPLTGWLDPSGFRGFPGEELVPKLDP